MNLREVFKTQKIKTDVTTKVFIKEYYDKIYIDKSYQRFEVWTKENKLLFIEALYKSLVSHPIILIKVDMCRSQSEMDGNKEDFEYFDSIYRQGYQYISIDGNNRTQTINSYYNGFINPIYRDDDKEYFNEIGISLVIYTNITKEQIHELAINVNKNTSWNAQESRNAINSPISSLIRDIRDDIKDIVLANVKGYRGNIRMGLDETLVKMLAYENYGKVRLNKATLDRVYTDPYIETKVFMKNINTVKELLNYHNTIKLNNYDFLNLYKLVSYFNKNNVRMTNMKNFYNDFCETNIKRKACKKTYQSQNGKILTWALLNGSVDLDYDLKMGIMLKDLNLRSYAVIVDNKRSFNINDKITIWEKNNHKVRVNNIDNPIDGNVYDSNNNESYKEITLTELLTDKYVVDHIDPHSLGGETNIENGEVTTREYNQWKYNKTYDVV